MNEYTNTPLSTQVEIYAEPVQLLLLTTWIPIPGEHRFNVFRDNAKLAERGPFYMTQSSTPCEVSTISVFFSDKRPDETTYGIYAIEYFDPTKEEYASMYAGDSNAMIAVLNLLDCKGMRVANVDTYYYHN